MSELTDRIETVADGAKRTLRNPPTEPCCVILQEGPWMPIRVTGAQDRIEVKRLLVGSTWRIEEVGLVETYVPATVEDGGGGTVADAASSMAIDSMNRLRRSVDEPWL